MKAFWKREKDMLPYYIIGWFIGQLIILLTGGTISMLSSLITLVVILLIVLFLDYINYKREDKYGI